MPRWFSVLVVEAVHDRNGGFGEHHLYCVGCGLDDLIEQGAVVFTRALQDPVCATHTAGRLANADTKPHEVGRLEMVTDRLQTIVTSQTATHLDLETTGFKVKFIVHDNQLLEILDAVTSNEHPDRLSAAIHVGLRERDCDSVFADAQLVSMRRFARRFERAAVTFDKFVNDLDANIVARALVVVSWISEADDQKVRRCASAWFSLVLSA